MENFFSNVSDYVKSRLNNPLLGTLLIIFIFLHFDFLFALFNFDEGVILPQKIKYIHDYWDRYGTKEKATNKILLAFGIMLLTFILLAIAKALTNAYNRLVDFIDDKSDKGSVVSRTKHELIKTERNSLRTEKEELENRIVNRDSDIRDLKSEITAIVSRNERISGELESALDEINELKNDNSNFLLTQENKTLENTILGKDLHIKKLNEEVSELINQISELNERYTFRKEEEESLKALGYERNPNIDVTPELVKAEKFLTTDRFKHLRSHYKSQIFLILENIDLSKFVELAANTLDLKRGRWVITYSELEPYLFLELFIIKAVISSDVTDIEFDDIELTELGRILYNNISITFN
jgi:peptidoglycan hydrolase CwlO-like protein